MIFVEVEAEFEKNQVKAVALAFFYELIACYLEDVGSGHVGIDVYKLSFLSLNFTLCDNEVGIFAVTRSEIDRFVVFGQEVGKVEGELMNNSEVHQQVANLCVALAVVFILLKCNCVCYAHCKYQLSYFKW